MTRPLARSALGFCSFAAIFALGACGSSAPATGGRAGSGGGKAGGGGSGGAGGGASDSQTTGAAGAQTIGTSGGVVTQSDVSLAIPAGALPADTAITITTIAAPSTYVPASAVYQFGPDGTTFAQPVTVAIPLNAPTPGAHLFWSNARGGFDDLGGTVTGTTLTGMVMHFSVGFAAVPAADGGSSDGPAAGNDAGGGTDAGGQTSDAVTDSRADAASDGTAGSTAADGGGAGNDASAPEDTGNVNDASAEAGSGATDAGVDASSLCKATGFNAPVFTPVIVNDGSMAPAGSTYTGGTIGTGQAYLTGVTHYGSTYGGATQAVYIFDATAKTLKISEFVGGAVYYLGLDISFPDAHTLLGTVVCSTTPQNLTQIAWDYTVGTKLTMSVVGSSDVETLSGNLAP